MTPLRVSLEGLSVGDAFGEQFFGEGVVVAPRIQARMLPPGPWRYTDDTEMAISIVEQLEECGAIDQDHLALRFAKRMDVSRGYGQGAYDLLTAIRAGRAWRAAARNSFRGMGSFGNGAAMRVAPLGAFFASDLDRVMREATASAEITHAHPEGIAGAIAVAVATALSPRATAADTFLEAICARVPAGYTHDAIVEAMGIPASAGSIAAAIALGNGSGVTAPDTVPLCLWVAAHHLDSTYEQALWATVVALGDRDTTCAIVGGILAPRFGAEAIPRAWRDAREPLPPAR
jgi:ADP-ribosylglycohydrolase